MKKLPILSVKQRISDLEIFLSLTKNYFDTINTDSYGGYSESPQSMLIRSQINSMVGKIELFVHESNTTDVFHYRAAPVAGGYTQNIPLLQNVFSLVAYRIPPITLFDVVERVIADYQDDITYAWIRTFNPFYWISLVIHELVVLPFKLLSSSGFNGEKAQHSYIGKIVMLLLNAALYLITFLSGVATILGSVNKLDWAINLMNRFGVQ